MSARARGRDYKRRRVRSHTRAFSDTKLQQSVREMIDTRAILTRKSIILAQSGSFNCAELAACLHQVSKCVCAKVSLQHLKVTKFVRACVFGGHNLRPICERASARAAAATAAAVVLMSLLCRWF